jgi:hypothetical protein
MKPSHALILIPLLAACPALAATPARSSSKAAVHKPVLPFQGDYAKAVAQAKARKVPLFVEAWAPW